MEETCVIQSLMVRCCVTDLPSPFTGNAEACRGLTS
jgi:hypothetical protein